MRRWTVYRRQGRGTDVDRAGRLTTRRVASTRAVWPNYAAAAWALAFAMPHAYWAAGGSVGLVAAVSADLAADRSIGFRVLNGGIVGFCAAGALVAFLSARLPLRPTARRVVRGLLWVGFALLLLRVLDIAVELTVGFATLDHAPAPAGAQFRRLAPWFGLLWMPWFGLGAILYGLAAARSSPGSAADVTTTPAASPP